MIARRFLAWTLRLVLAGPPLLLGVGLIEAAARISALCVWIEGDPGRPS